MTARVNRRLQADCDLVEHFVNLAEEASINIADRFLAAVHQSFEELARMPNIGQVTDFKNPRFVGMRRWRIRGFPNHSIFYFPTKQGVDIVRVLHGPRDLDELFG